MDFQQDFGNNLHRKIQTENLSENSSAIVSSWSGKALKILTENLFENPY